MEIDDRDLKGCASGLWEEHPVSKELPEPYPENRTARLSLPENAYGRDRFIIAASVRGKKHKHTGTNCDDWFELAESDGHVLFALADGAGSKPYSRIGAKEGCVGAISGMKNALVRLRQSGRELKRGAGYPLDAAEFLQTCGEIAQIVQAGVESARAQVKKAYQIREKDAAYSKPLKRALALEDFASTLLSGILFSVNEGASQQFVAGACQIGDGAVAAVCQDVQGETVLKLLGAGDHGRFAGETEFLTTAGAAAGQSIQSRIRITRGRFHALIAASDGVSDDYFPEDPGFLNLYSDLQENVLLCQNQDEKEEERLRMWLDSYVKRGSFDDRTVIVASFEQEKGGTVF